MSEQYQIHEQQFESIDNFPISETIVELKPSSTVSVLHDEIQALLKKEITSFRILLISRNKIHFIISIENNELRALSSTNTRNWGRIFLSREFEFYNGFQNFTPPSYTLVDWFRSLYERAVGEGRIKLHINNDTDLAQLLKVMGLTDQYNDMIFKTK